MIRSAHFGKSTTSYDGLPTTFRLPRFVSAADLAMSTAIW